MDGGHFTGLWVEVRVILRKRNWVNKKEKKKKRKGRKEPEADALSGGTGPPHQEDQSCVPRRGE